MKRDALDSTKMKRLVRRLDLPRYAAIGLMESLWKLTERDAPQGDIGKLSNEDIAVQLDWRGDEDVLVNVLVACGWLDANTGFARLWVHDWDQHCEDTVHARLARSRQIFANGVVPHLKKLSKDERAAAETYYAAAESAKRQPREEDGTLPTPIPIPSPDPAISDEHAMALRIVCAHPRAVEVHLQPGEVDPEDVDAVKVAIGDEVRRVGGSREVAAAVMLVSVQAITSVVVQWPPGDMQYLSGIAKFFKRHEYRKDAKEWMRNGGQGGDGRQRESGNERQQRALDQAQRVLERRLARGLGGGPVRHDSVPAA